MDWGRLDVNEFRQFVNECIDHWKQEYLFGSDALNQFHHEFNWRIEEERARKDQEKKLVMAERRAAEKKAAASQSKANPGMSMDGTAEADAMEGVADDVAKTTDIGDTNHESQDVKMEDQPPSNVSNQEEKEESLVDQVPGETAAARARRKRPKAEDMFASDEE